MLPALPFRRWLALAICPELAAAPAEAAPTPSDRVSGEAAISALILKLAEARGWKPSYAARMASGSGDTLTRLAGGIGLTIRRANAIIARCSELWPEGTPWPADIPRPDKAKQEVA